MQETVAVIKEEESVEQRSALEGFWQGRPIPLVYRPDMIYMRRGECPPVLGRPRHFNIFRLQTARLFLKQKSRQVGDLCAVTASECRVLDRYHFLAALLQVEEQLASHEIELGEKHKREMAAQQVSRGRNTV